MACFHQRLFPPSPEQSSCSSSLAALASSPPLPSVFKASPEPASTTGTILPPRFANSQDRRIAEAHQRTSLPGHSSPNSGPRFQIHGKHTSRETGLGAASPRPGSRSEDDVCITSGGSEHPFQVHHPTEPWPTTSSGLRSRRRDTISDPSSLLPGRKVATMSLASEDGG
ncbi:hypothetical protein CF336_g9110 [Tilletia laevis]|nr:hypothetical protein CF335_g9113 [Tilletia laevis]KAE8180911.1 hypothetical protein CF336_g9110 [Tilletia laevis]